MTARSWDRWVEYYRAKGHEVIVPTYPGFEIEVEALREKPEIIAEASVPETVDHLSEVVEGLNTPNHHGPLLRRNLHATPGQPRTGRRRRGDRLGATRGRAGQPAVPDQVAVPD